MDKFDPINIFQIRIIDQPLHQFRILVQYLFGQNLEFTRKSDQTGNQCPNRCYQLGNQQPKHQCQYQQARNQCQNNSNHTTPLWILDLFKKSFKGTHGNIQNKCQRCAQNKRRKYTLYDRIYRLNPLCFMKQPIQKDTAGYHYK